MLHQGRYLCALLRTFPSIAHLMLVVGLCCGNIYLTLQLLSICLLSGTHKTLSKRTISIMDSDDLFATPLYINWRFTEETPGHESTPNPLHAVFGQSATSSQQRQVPGQVLNPIDDAQMHQVRNNNPNITQSQENHSSSDNVAERPAPKATKRSKFGKLDWDYHKEKIRILYLEENKSLAETMELMRQRHGFDAS